ncbi:NDP-hexose-3-ketoreductase [Nocardiopsis mwathae]|uniref:NDP-hexose-3-ketoreductase n=2 Tax=Nocardiopsis mwathae TaxID=1472723 RepID=A0A7W9YLC2_9ACTN|nr:NDP-hexose-3-ketoreductase [Nocardiopsis mwathae]
MSADPNIDIVAVASRKPTKGERFADRFDCAALSHYEDLLQRSDIDAIYIPLPAMLHAEWITAALSAGKHVLVEKPLVDSGQRTAEVIELARSRQLVLLDNLMFLHHSQHTTVQKLLAQDTIGELRCFSSSFTIPPRPENDIRYKEEVGGGALLDIGVYPLQAALHFLGPDLDVVGAVLRRESRRQVMVSGNALLCTPEGVIAEVSFGMEHSYRTTYELSGSSGRIFLDRVFTPPDTYQPVVHIDRQDHREEIVLPADRQFANVLRFFFNAVLDGTDVTPHQNAAIRHAMLSDEIRAKARVIDF